MTAIAVMIAIWVTIESTILFHFLTKFSKEIERCREIEQVYRRLIDLLPVSKSTL